jgi:hypothetical protein
LFELENQSACFSKLCVVAMVGGMWLVGCHKSPSTSPSELTTSVSVTTTTTDAAGITLSAPTLTFGAQAVGVAGTAQSLVFTNGSASTLTLTGISVTGDFSETHTCGAALAPRSSCQIRVTFVPRAIGTRTGALLIADDASTGPHVVPLDGTGGVSQGLSLAPAYLEFPSQLVGTTATQTVTLRNIGTSPVAVSAVTTTGDFTQSNTCASAIGGGASCTVTITFSPTAAGTRTGLVTISDDAPGGPHVFPVSGVGYADAPSVMLLPTSLFFPDQVVGAEATTFTAQIVNTGAASLELQSISTTGDFTQANSCATSLAKGVICNLGVTFRPTATGTRTGTIVIVDNAPGSPHIIALHGIGVDPATAGPLVKLSSSALTFEATAIGAVSAEQTVTLSNTGKTAVALRTVDATGDFVAQNGCPTSLAAGDSCAIVAQFMPRSPGVRTGAITIDDSAPGSPHTVLLKGSGVGATGPSLAVTPAVVAFGIRTVGVPGDGIDLVMRNNGSEPLAVREVSAGGEFSASGCASVTLATNAECTVTVRFSPAVAGARSGTLTIGSNAPGSPVRVPLTGEGAAGGLVYAPTFLTFAGHSVGATSAALTLSFTNTTGVAVTITRVSTTGDFAVVNDCGDRLAPNVTCTMSVTFSPTALGTRTGTLTIVDDTDGSPRQIPLKGTAF